MTSIRKMDYTYMTEKSGQYTIIWTGFNTLLSSLHDMQSDQYLQDVTLVTDDRMHTKAQKLILASGSTILKRLLLDQDENHPFIHFHGRVQHEVESLLKLMYCGEINIKDEKSATKLLQFAASLGIDDKRNFSVRNCVEDNKLEKKENADAEKEDNLVNTIVKDENETNTFETDKSAPNDALSEQSVNDEEYEEGFEGVWGNTHKIDSKELKPTVSNNGKKCIVNFDVSTGKTKYSCVNCGKTSNDRSNLWDHIYSVHERRKHPCTKCSYQASNRSNLWQHVKSIHENVKYPCTTTTCSYQASNRSNLRHHVKSKHENAKFTYRKKRQDNLTKH